MSPELVLATVSTADELAAVPACIKMVLFSTAVPEGKLTVIELMVSLEAAPWRQIKSKAPLSVRLAFGLGLSRPGNFLAVTGDGIADVAALSTWNVPPVFTVYVVTLIAVAAASNIMLPRTALDGDGAAGAVGRGDFEDTDADQSWSAPRQPKLSPIVPATVAYIAVVDGDRRAGRHDRPSPANTSWSPPAMRLRRRLVNTCW